MTRASPKTLTANLNLDFRTDPFNSFYARMFYSNAKRRGVKYETDIDIDTRFQDAVGGRKTYEELTPDYGRGSPGDDGSRASRGWIGTEDDRKTDLYSINLGGRHESPNSLLTYDFFYSRNKQTTTNDNELNFLMEPDDPWLQFEYHLIDPSRGQVEINELSGRDPTDLSLVTEGELIMNNSVRTEDVFSARADFERNFDARTQRLHGEDGRANIIAARRASTRYPTSIRWTTLSPMRRSSRPNNTVILGGTKYFDVNPAKGVALLRNDPDLFSQEEEDFARGQLFRGL